MKNNNSWDFNFNLGKEFEKEGKLEEAVSCYKKSIDLNPQQSHLYYRLSNVLEKQGQFELAIENYKKSIDLNYNQPWYHIGLGNCYLQSGKVEDALFAYFKAIEVQPNLLIIYVKLNSIVKRGLIKEDSFDQLFKLYEKVINSNSELIDEVYRNLGDIFTFQGKIDRAIFYYKKSGYNKLLKHNPKLIQESQETRYIREPNFLIIGAAKCGTTSLYDYITQHSQVSPALTKELHFFDQNFNNGLDWYLSQFLPVPHNQNLITGESTPEYLVSNLQDQVYKYFPQVKLIIILRNPVHRAISHYYHAVRAGGEKRSLENAINSEIEKLRSLTNTQNVFQYYNGWNSYLWFGLYFYFIEKWMSVFPQNNFLILKSEELFKNQILTMKQVFNFLELDENLSSQSEYKALNAGIYNKKNNETEVYRALAYFFEPYNQKLEDYLGIKFDWKL